MLTIVLLALVNRFVHAHVPSPVPKIQKEIASLLYYVIISVPLVFIVICTRIRRGQLDVVITYASCLCVNCCNLILKRVGSKEYTKELKVLSV